MATATADGYVINGQKTFALRSSRRSTHRHPRLGDANGPVSLFVVPSDSPGLKLQPAVIDERRCRISIGQRVGRRRCDLGPNWPGPDRGCKRGPGPGCLAVCAEACGAMAAVAEQTVEYLKVRLNSVNRSQNFRYCSIGWST